MNPSDNNLLMMVPPTMSGRRNLTVALFATLMAVCLPGIGFAQFTSTVEGTVFDPNGGPVPQAKIFLENRQTNVRIDSGSDSTGHYRFNGIVPGPYQLTAEAFGFTASKVNFTATTDQVAGVNVTLQLASTSSQVTVTELAEGVNPDETRLQVTLKGSDLIQLPLQSRGVLNLVKVAPGVTGITENAENIPIGLNQPDARANGRPSAGNLYLIDGLPVTDPTGTGALLITPNADMVREVALQTNTFAVDNGATSSLQIDFTTKSGENQMHGNGDISYTGKSLSAVPYFASANAPFTRKYFSGSLGGPVIRNKTFFFGSFQTQKKASSSSGLVTYETPEFTDWALKNYPNSQDVKNILAAFRPTRLQILKNTLYGRDAYAGTCGTAAAGNIPCDLPLQNQGLFNQSPRVDGTQYNVRLDHYFRAAKDRVSFGFFRVDQTSDYLDVRPGYDSVTPSSSYFYSANYTHTFSPSLLNQASFGFTRITSCFGCAGQRNYVLIPQTTLVFGPFYFFGSPFATSADKQHRYDFRDSVSWVKNRHTVKVGFQISHLDYWQDRAGVYSRPFNYFFSNLVDFLNDKPLQESFYTLSGTTGKWIGQYYGAQTTQFGSYAQDEWKIRPNLLLTFGLRWDDFGNPTKYGYQAGAFSQVIPGAGSTLPEQISNTFLKGVDSAFGRRLNNNFLPRASFAWSPKFDRKLSIRGGMGLYEDPLQLAGITANLPTQPPTRLTLDLSQFNPNNPAPYPAFGTTTAQAPWGYTYPTLNLKGLDSRGAAVGYTGSLNGVTQSLVPQKSGIWNLGFEREIAKGVVAGVLYSGSHSWDQIYSGDFNTLAGDLIDGRQDRLTSEFGKINFTRNGLEANYHALIVTARQSVGRLLWQASYTHSKTTSDPIGESSPDIYNPKAFYGLSSIDVPDRFTLSAVYELPTPFSNRYVKAATKGWTVGAVIIAQSGTPFTVSNQNSFSSGGDFNADGNNYDLPNVAAGTKTSGWSNTQYIQGIFSADAFTTPAGYKKTAVQGNQGRNIFRGPDYRTFDASFLKKTTLPWFHDKQSVLTLRVEGFNLLNRVNLTGANTNTAGNNFGQWTNTQQARVMQLGARFEF